MFLKKENIQELERQNGKNTRKCKDQNNVVKFKPKVEQ